MTKGWDEDKGLNAQVKAAAPVHRGAEPEEMAGMVVLFVCLCASLRGEWTCPINAS